MLLPLPIAFPAFASSSREGDIVQTACGAVRGTAEFGVQVFRGIPYAADTGGSNRFRPPQPRAPWTGVLECHRSGKSAPQQVRIAPERAPFAQITEIGEDCLSLNVFTEHAHPHSSRPVMVWLHGGGWRTGSSAAPALQGHRLALEGDVVLVTVNHRLDVLGYLRIDDGSEEFADSGNLGVLDLIAALKWVRDNIAQFGGNPANVTIFGQSGGGSKVAALMAAPAARGLFAKAIAMSCSGCLRLTERPEADAIAANVARNLGRTRLEGRVLQTLPLAAIVASAQSGCRPMIDGRTFSRHPFDPDAPPTATAVPLLIGNVANETRMTLAGGGPQNFHLDQAVVLRRLGRFLGLDEEPTRELYGYYAAENPTAGPSDILAAITGDYTYIRNTRRMADLQAWQAPVYSYLFARRTPVLGGVLGSAHECDVPFVFGTTAAAASMVGTGPDMAPLTRMMIRTWSRFAHTGRPDHLGFPQWPVHRPGSAKSMILDLHPRFANIPGNVARAHLSNLPWYEYSRVANYAHD